MTNYDRQSSTVRIARWLRYVPYYFCQCIFFVVAWHCSGCPQLYEQVQMSWRETMRHLWVCCMSKAEHRMGMSRPIEEFLAELDQVQGVAE